MPSEDCRFSAFLYRYRGYILGAIAVALVCAPPSLFPNDFFSGAFDVCELGMDNCSLGILVAVVLYVASALLRVRSRQFIGEHTRGSVHAAEVLVTCGPYSRMRHPLYVSNTGFALGVAFFHLGVSLWIVPFMLVVVAFEIELSRIEDLFLERKFGDMWRAWASKTPAFLPRPCALRSSRDLSCGASCNALVPRTFWQAFFADSSTWLWLLFCNLLLVLRKVAFFYV